MDVTSLADLDAEPHAEVFETRAPRVVRLSLAAGESVPPHRHPGTDVCVHVVEGALDLTVAGETRSLAAGDLARFSGDSEVSPAAREDATAVVTFAPASDG